MLTAELIGERIAIAPAAFEQVRRSGRIFAISGGGGGRRHPDSRLDGSGDSTGIPAPFFLVEILHLDQKHLIEGVDGHDRKEALP
jgi:hypothetical protein